MLNRLFDSEDDARLREMGYEVGTLVTLGRLQKKEFLFLNSRPARVMGLQRKGSVEQILVKLDEHQGNEFPPLPPHVLGCAYALRPANVFPAAPGRVAGAAAGAAPASPVRLRGSPSVGRGGGGGSGGDGRVTPRSLAAAAASPSSSSVPPPPLLRAPPLVVGAWERTAWWLFFALNVVLALHVGAECWANAPSSSSPGTAAAAGAHGPPPGVGRGRRQRDGSGSGGGGGGGGGGG
eukprot:Rhum_TRINITY_DN4387_c0_g1::Rhum_TRINITY_DN4387_c0_g1_i1::g.14122::m.14122